MEGTHGAWSWLTAHAEPRAEAAGLGSLPGETEANHGLLFGCYWFPPSPPHEAVPITSIPGMSPLTPPALPPFPLYLHQAEGQMPTFTRTKRAPSSADRGSQGPIPFPYHIHFPSDHADRAAT